MPTKFKWNHDDLFAYFDIRFDAQKVLEEIKRLVGEEMEKRAKIEIEARQNTGWLPWQTSKEESPQSNWRAHYIGGGPVLDSPYIMPPVSWKRNLLWVDKEESSEPEKLHFISPEMIADEYRMYHSEIVVDIMTDDDELSFIIKGRSEVEYFPVLNVIRQDRRLSISSIQAWEGDPFRQTLVVCSCYPTIIAGE